MQFTDFSKLDLSRLPTPCFVVDEVAIERNLRILRQVADASGAKVLSALKAFSMWRLCWGGRKRSVGLGMRRARKHRPSSIDP